MLRSYRVPRADPCHAGGIPYVDPCHAGVVLTHCSFSCPRFAFRERRRSWSRMRQMENSLATWYPPVKSPNHRSAALQASPGFLSDSGRHNAPKTASKPCIDCLFRILLNEDDPMCSGAVRLFVAEEWLMVGELENLRDRYLRPSHSSQLSSRTSPKSTRLSDLSNQNIRPPQAGSRTGWYALISWPRFDSVLLLACCRCSRAGNGNDV